MIKCEVLIRELENCEKKNQTIEAINDQNFSLFKYQKLSQVKTTIGPFTIQLSIEDNKVIIIVIKRTAVFCDS